MILDTRVRVVEGLLELLHAPDGTIKSNVVSAISELGYPEFCDPLYNLLKDTGNERLVSVYCSCASRDEKEILIEFLESEKDFIVSCAAWAAERLIFTELIPVLEKISPPERAVDDVKRVLDYLKDNTRL